MSPARLFGVWLLLAIVMSANGIFREIVLRPRLGSTAADIISAALGIAIILLVTFFLLRPFAGGSLSQLGVASAMLVALTVAFEFFVGHYVDHKSWSELVANYAIWRGRLWPIVLLVLALTPFLWARSIRVERPDVATNR
jgi:ABC-type multidrug transport system permease subunit